MDIQYIIQWTATATGIIAAIMVAFNVSPKLVGWGFVVFTVSSMFWISFGLMSNETPLTVQNIVLLIINLVGTYRWLLRPLFGEPAPSEESAR